MLYKQSHEHALSWAGVNTAHKEQYGNVLGLIDIILSLPCQLGRCRVRVQPAEAYKEQHTVEHVGSPIDRLDDSTATITINSSLLRPWSCGVLVVLAGHIHNHSVQDRAKAVTETAAIPKHLCAGELIIWSDIKPARLLTMLCSISMITFF